jgi:hypothetical protein
MISVSVMSRNDGKGRMLGQGTWWIWRMVPGGEDGPDRGQRVRQDVAATRDVYAAGTHQVVVNFPSTGRPDPRRDRERWLLVFDNADIPEDIAHWLPGGSGHVLITSRSGGWEEVAVPVEVDVLERGESVTLLRHRIPGLSETDAGLIAETLGDLPLAIAQAAGYMTQSGTSAVEYVGLLRTRAVEILECGRPASYPLTLAAVTQLALDRLTADSPAAAQAVRMCAFLAPEPVPAVWFALAARQLPAPLNAVAADPLAWGRVLTQIGCWMMLPPEERMRAVTSVRLHLRA